jgi:hypothetical protein
MGRVYELPDHMLVEIKVKLPRDIVEWLKELSKARNETIDEVLTWTLGNILNFYDRWMCRKKSKRSK